MPVKPCPNWYRKLERYIKGFSPFLSERFNWYKTVGMLSVRFGSDTTDTPIPLLWYLYNSPNQAQLQLLESKYEEQMGLHSRHLENALQTIAIERKDKDTFLGVIETMTESQQGPKYDLRGAQFGGGMAEVVKGNQVGGTINNYGAKLKDIAQLLSNLREQAKTFPDEYRDDALDTINDLEMDLKEASPNRNKIGRQLKRLVAAASAVGVITGGAATFSGDLKEFTGNVVELTEVLKLPVEFTQLDEHNFTDN